MAGKSLPVVNSIDREFWEGAAKGELRLQKCGACGKMQFFPRIACTGCLGGDLEWVPVSGRGKVHTFSLCRVPRNRAFMDEVPIYVAEVELEEGVRMITRIVGDNRDQVTLGAPVTVSFLETEDPDIKLPVFELVP